MTKIKLVRVTVDQFRAAMAKDWGTYHATYECSEDEDLADMLERADGKLDRALELAKEQTDLWNEMQSNCY